MEIINTSSILKLKGMIKEFKKNKKKVIVKSQDDDFNRKVLENKDVDVLLFQDFDDKKDRQKQRDSGLNEFYSRLAHENDITIGFNLDNLIKKNRTQKASYLAKLRQNISLCKRTKTKIEIFPKKFNKNDIIALFKTLNAPSDMARTAF